MMKSLFRRAMARVSPGCYCGAGWGLGLVLAAALAGGGATRVLADVSPAAPATVPADADYEACQQVLQSIADGFENEDSSAVLAQIYFGPDADPQFVHLEPSLCEATRAAYRLKKDAVAKFAAHAIEINFYVADGVAAVEELLNRIGPRDFSRAGDTLVINPPAPFLSHTNAWPKAPMYFKKVGPDWKLDAGRTYQLIVDVRRTIPIAGETPEQATAAVIKEITDAYDAMAADVEQNNITSAADLQKRIDKIVIGLTVKYRQLTINQIPRPTAQSGGGL